MKNLVGNETFPHEEHIQVLIRLSGLPVGVAVREKKIFVQKNITHINVYQDEADSPGNAVTAWCGLRAAYVLGERGKRAEDVATETLEMLMKEKGDVDMHLADQLLIYAVLAEGKTNYSTSEISEHLRTNARIIGKFLQERKIEIDEKEQKITIQ